MKICNTCDRLKEIMDTTGMRQVDILNAARPFCEKYGVKLAKNDLSQYVNGKVDPGQEKLTILGLALNVSEAWLMGYDVPMQRENDGQRVRGNELSKIQEEIAKCANRLTAEQAVLALRILKSILGDD